MNPLHPSDPPAAEVIVEEQSQPRWHKVLYRFRHWLAVLYGLLAVGITSVFLIENSGFGTVLIGLVITLLLQAGFLAGAPHLSWPRPRSRRSIIVSKLVAAFIAAALTFGICASIVSLIELIHKSEFRFGTYTFVIAWVGLWGAWCIPFLLIWTGQWLPMFRRIYKMIFAGTILELLITLPIDVQVRKRTQCYCGEGTFFALVIGITIAVWSFGPGLILLYLSRRMQRRQLLGYCQNCSYDLRGLTEPRCPECGTPFTLKQRA